ncbi:hypothetical protein F66182_7097 [Fusarium sp. NRRL 66182]|nr:hypothetical protein F66182_7097 [Fusarium sp. NRRL 66182]
MLIPSPQKLSPAAVSASNSTLLTPFQRIAGTVRSMHIWMPSTEPAHRLVRIPTILSQSRISVSGDRLPSVVYPSDRGLLGNNGSGFKTSSATRAVKAFYARPWTTYTSLPSGQGLGWLGNEMDLTLRPESATESTSMNEYYPMSRSMALVDYSSSESADESAGPESTSHRVKRRKGVDGTAAHSSRPSDLADGAARSVTNDAAASSMPPLPDTFHDLYASTVRQSVVDDPSLHQGRKRQVPHVAGNWPSHVYTEWHPSTVQHDLLTRLLADIEEQVGEEITLHKFLTSDLGSPLPLHISLSRPLSLTTGSKDEFLDRITESLHSSGIAPFAVRPRDLAWYRSPDSDRTFLILRVASGPSPAAHSQDEARPSNPELTTLLTRSNTVATQFGLPTLYQRDAEEQVGSAFHISIGWTFHLPADDMSLKTLRLFRQTKFAAIRDWEISVSGIKAKIGNAVNHIALKETGRSGGPSKSASFLKS